MPAISNYISSQLGGVGQTVYGASGFGGNTLGVTSGGGSPTGTASSGVNYGTTSGGGMEGVLEPTPSAPAIDYDALIAPALQALDQAVGPAQSAYDANIADIDAYTGKAVSGQKSALQEAQLAAEQNKQRNTFAAEDAIDEQRRGFSEIGQGIQSRYGGTTGTGKFATEIAGARTMKNIGAFRQGLSQALQTIGDRFEQVKTATQFAIQDLEDRGQADKLKAKANLDATLNQIRMAKGELQSNKAQMAAEAMQFYQKQLADINARNSAFKQEIFVQEQAAQQQLAAAQSKAQGAIKQFQATQLGVTPDGSPIFGSFNPYTGQSQPFNVGGSLGATQEEDDGYGLANI